MAAPTKENVNPMVLRKVAKELTKLAGSPLEGIKVHVNEDNIADIQATIAGPSGTPYHGGAFLVKLVLSEDFPTTAPKGFFMTKIFHPNVARDGAICVNTLKKDWKPEYGLEHVLTVIKCLLIYPNPASALNEEAGKLLLEAYDDYARHAKMMTEIHARPKDAAAAAVAAAGDVPDATAAAGASAAIAAKKAVPVAAAVDKKRNLKRL